MSNALENLAEGDDLVAMKALRRVLAEALVAGSFGRDTVAGLSAEFRNVLVELSKLGATEEDSPVNEIAARRALRRAS